MQSASRGWGFDPSLHVRFVQTAIGKAHRTCADGSPQRAWISKQEAASPTVATDSMFVTSAIAAAEKRHVRTFDVPGAFLVAEGACGRAVVQTGPVSCQQTALEEGHMQPHVFFPFFFLFGAPAFCGRAPPPMQLGLGGRGPLWAMALVSSSTFASDSSRGLGCPLAAANTGLPT